jgi:hypothetical protein
MAIKIPTTFVNYLKTKLKKCETYEIETKIFEIQNAEEYIQNFISISNDEITHFLVGYLTRKTNKQLINGNAINCLLTEDPSETPSYKSNSEIIITPFKKDQVEYLIDDEVSIEQQDYEDFVNEHNMLDLIQNSIIKMDETEEKLDFTLNSHQYEANLEDSIENIDSRKLFQLSEQFEKEAPLEVSKIIDHIDSLVEENHRKNSYDINESTSTLSPTTDIEAIEDCVQVIPDSDSNINDLNASTDSLIPDTPIKFLNFDGLKFSPNILDKFSKSPIVLVKPIEIPKEVTLNKTPVKFIVKQNEIEVLVTPEQKSPNSRRGSSEASLKITKPVKEFDNMTSSPKQIASFNSKLINNSKKQLFTDSNESAINSAEVIIEEVVLSSDQEETKRKKTPEIMKPITFSKRISMFLRKDIVSKEAEVPAIDDSTSIKYKPLIFTDEIEKSLPKRSSTRIRNSIISSSTLSQELVGKTRDDELIIIEDDKLIKNNNNASVEETNVEKTSRKRSLPIVKKLSNVKRSNSLDDVKKIDYSDVESFDDSDNDITYVKSKSQLTKSKVMRHSFTSREETPVKSKF